MIQRHLKPLVEESLEHFPVVAILGPRQVGKSTLAQMLPSKRWPAQYLTLDDMTLLDAALRDPDGFLEGLDFPVIVDEIQRAPDLLRSIKRVVDRDRRPGLCLLTGSANLLTLQNVSETLAGRAVLLDLHPFSWGELQRQPSPSPSLDALFASRTAKEFVTCLPESTPVTRRDPRVVLHRHGPGLPPLRLRRLGAG